MGKNRIAFLADFDTGLQETEGEALTCVLGGRQWILVIHMTQGCWALSDSVSGRRITYLGYESEGIRDTAKTRLKQLVTDHGPDEFIKALDDARKDRQVLQQPDAHSDLRPDDGAPQSAVQQPRKPDQVG